MSWQNTPYVAVLLGAAVLCAALVGYTVWYIYRYERDRTVVAFAVLMAGMAVYSFARGMQLGFTARADKLFWVRLVYLGYAPGVVAWFVFSVEYNATAPRLGRRSLAALGAYSLVVAVAGLTNPWHELMWSRDPAATTVTGETVLTLDRSFGPLFLLFIFVAYVLFVVGLLFLLRTAISDKSLFRGQALAIGFGAIVPVVTALPYLFGVGPGGVDFTPASFGIGGLAYAYAIFRHRMLHVKPVARDTVVSSMRDGFVVLDQRGQIVDYNAAAATFLDEEELVGKQLTEIVSLSGPNNQHRAAEDAAAERTEQTLAGVEARSAAGADQPEQDTGDGQPPAEIAARSDGDGAKRVGVFTTDEGRSIEVEQSPLVHNGRPTGRLVLFRDTTERTRREQLRQRKNERLEQFASIVSHDLRSPLTVATTELELVQDEVDNDRLDSIERSLRRMETLIDDTLTLARQGQTVADREPVDLIALARQSWSVVETGDSSLVTDDDIWVDADPQRLQQVFENLFRNAIEHGSPDGAGVTVRVGRLPDGFYVEDDGPGIDPSIREELFDPGVTTDDSGTGFGLAITSDVVEAHGWEIAVTDGTDGGARFEITGVDFVAPDGRERTDTEQASATNG